MPPLFALTPAAARRVVEFFTAQINNDNTRRAYLNAAKRFAAWCDAYGIDELADVQPVLIAKSAGIRTKVGNHTFRAPGITAYLKNGGKLKIAQVMANHESARTPGLLRPARR